MEQEGKAILIAVMILVFLCFIILILFTVFQKRKNKLLLAQKSAKKQFEEELAITQIEIREETFRNISWELHDNIGQLITLAKIQLQNNAPRKEVKKTLNHGLNELRALSKNINPDALKNIGLTNAIKQEIERFNRLNFINSTLDIVGAPRAIDQKIEIIFFRILQEFFSNTIKHAQASNLNVIIEYNIDSILITAKDDGKGFNTSLENNLGIGLINIKNRAKLVRAEAVITSAPEKGTKLQISYPY